VAQRETNPALDSQITEGMITAGVAQIPAEWVERHTHGGLIDIVTRIYRAMRNGGSNDGS
jgi:hypothetical protein